MGAGRQAGWRAGLAGLGEEVVGSGLFFKFNVGEGLIRWCAVLHGTAHKLRR